MDDAGETRHAKAVTPMPHDHTPEGPAGPGHNHFPGAAHLHSHMAPDEAADALQALTAQFIDGFREAADKAAYLSLAGVPREIDSDVDGAPLKLVDVSIQSSWQVGAASPAFGSKALSYQPFPGPMIRERINCALVYVSLTERKDVDLRAFLAARSAAG